MKLLHVSDLHLDSPFVGISQQLSQLHTYLMSAPIEALRRAVGIAINQQVDVVVISGDVYNSEQQSVLAQYQLSQEMERLNKANIPVVMVHGNHDYLRPDKAKVTYPENVHVLNEREVLSVTLPLKQESSNVTLYGFSYHSKWISDRVVNEFPVHDVLDDYAVGILHGGLDGIASDESRYAPFTVRELVEKNYDYWALGHIHKAAVLNEEPLIQYAGTPQGRHINETGDKGCYVIELHKGKAAVNTFFSLASIRWERHHIECSADFQTQDIIQQLHQIEANYLVEAQSNQQSYLVEVEFTQAQRLDSQLLSQIESGEFLELLNQNIDNQPFVMIYRINVSMQPPREMFDFDSSLEESFRSVIARLQEGEQFSLIMDEIYTHPVVRRLFQLHMDPSFKSDIIQEAQALIAQMAGLDVEEESVDVNYGEEEKGED